MVIGLVGEKGSGKETFTKFLAELFSKKISHVRFSDLLKETLALWNIPDSRENLQKLAVAMNQGFGEGTLSAAIYKRLKSTKTELVVLDGVRWESDVKLLKKFANNKLIYITADLKTRFERLKIRGEKTGENETSFEQFVLEENAANELLIPKIGSLADFKIENNGSFQDLKTETQKLITQL